MARTAWNEDPTGIEAEILGEKIATYVRIARTMERLVAELADARVGVLEAQGAVRRARLAAYDALRERARRQLWYLIVQREALGLRRHEGLDEHYPIPGPIAD